MAHTKYAFVVPDRWDPLPTLGLLALVIAVGGLVTGILLAFNYAPTFEAAQPSIVNIGSNVTLGGFLRGLHFWAGNFALVLAALHGIRVFWNGAYKAPRRALWVVGCGIFLVLLGFAYTGYLLRGDERALAGIVVADGVASSTPVVGGAASALLLGGEVISSVTLVRLYAIHTQVLPVALVGLALAFLWLWRRAGPARAHTDASDDTAPAWPRAILRDTVWAGVVVTLLAVFAVALPPEIGPKADLGGPGSPDAQPEWFFLWVNQLLHRVDGMTFLIGGLLPGLLVGLMFGLPFIARGKERAPRRRIPEIAIALLVLLGIGGLTAAALNREHVEHETEAEQPADTAPEAGAEFDVAPVLKKFRCAQCHTIDGDEDGGDTGPALNRKVFGELYTRKYFRLKVSNPGEFWEDTGMSYPRNRLPNDEELDALTEHFFGK